MRLAKRIFAEAKRKQQVARGGELLPNFVMRKERGK